MINSITIMVGMFLVLSLIISLGASAYEIKEVKFICFISLVLNLIFFLTELIKIQ